MGIGWGRVDMVICSRTFKMGSIIPSIVYGHPYFLEKYYFVWIEKQASSLLISHTKKDNNTIFLLDEMRERDCFIIDPFIHTSHPISSIFFIHFFFPISIAIIIIHLNLSVFLKLELSATEDLWALYSMTQLGGNPKTRFNVSLNCSSSRL